MGMFDTIILEKPLYCFSCGEKHSDFQTRDIVNGLKEFKIGDRVYKDNYNIVLYQSLYCCDDGFVYTVISEGILKFIHTDFGKVCEYITDGLEMKLEDFEEDGSHYPPFPLPLSEERKKRQQEEHEKWGKRIQETFNNQREYLNSHLSNQFHDITSEDFMKIVFEGYVHSNRADMFREFLLSDIPKEENQ